MSRETIWDNMNRPIGEIETKYDGNQVLWDSMNNPLGEYRKKTDDTWDNMNRRIGNGNQLLRLLK